MQTKIGIFIIVAYEEIETSVEYYTSGAHIEVKP